MYSMIRLTIASNSARSMFDWNVGAARVGSGRRLGRGTGPSSRQRTSAIVSQARL